VNLLSNAIKFTPEEGTISVRAYRSAGRIVIEVSDTGRGIEAKFLPYVFDRFRQADSSTTRAFGGLGIGLAIVRHLVELHGGTAHADSPGMGLGATFTVTLPVFERRPSDAGEASDARVEIKNVRALADGRLKGRQILVVDDEPDTRELLSQVFEQRGAVVVAAASAHEALEQLDRNELDLMVSDIGMAEEDGYGLMRKIRNNAGRYSRIPAIALTAYAREEDRAAALAAGFQVHLTKPVDPDALILSAQELVTTPLNS
jgi:CheY-like chemotaxis protein